MKKDKAIGVAVVAVLLIGAALVFFRLHNNMIDKQNGVVGGQGAEGTASEESPFQNITADQLFAALADKDFLLVNVHTPYMGEIKGTDEFISPSDLKDNLDKFPSDKNAKIVVYCRSGGMSRVAAQELVDFGYKNVVNLLGGMRAWEQAGYPLERSEENKI